MFGVGTLDRPWLDPAADPMAAARQKMAAAFEFIEKLGVPFYCFHDRDVAPGGRLLRRDSGQPRRAHRRRARATRSGPASQLLWGTANLFTHPRYQAGASTNPDPEVFAYAAAQVKQMLEVTQRLGGTNYVLWGGREGYDTLLNTDLKREGSQLARFLHLVAEHKHQIGFEGTLLIEPKPMEPTKHQYDYDSATVHGFLVRNGLEDEYRLNIEANHATLAGHCFHHEVAYAVAHGILGSIDANRGDPQNGWDTDQFPNSVEDLALPLYEILRGGGFTTGGFNFDAKLRRQSSARTDLFHAHVGGIDTLARALLVAAELLENETRRGRSRSATRAGAGRSARRSSTATSRSPRSRRRWPPGRSTRGLYPGARRSSRTGSTGQSGPSTASSAASRRARGPPRVMPDIHPRTARQAFRALRAALGVGISRERLLRWPRTTIRDV